MESVEIIAELKEYYNKKNIAGMKRFGISGKNVLGGPSIPILRKMAKKIGKDHKLAAELWKSGIHEARILAGMIDDPKQLSEKQMDSWVKDFDSWDLVDQTCMNLFDKTSFAEKKIYEWVGNEKEFIRRSAFSMIAVMAVHSNHKDNTFINYLSLIKKYSIDERNYVRKAVNWGLRQIGKRNKKLNRAAIKTAEQILCLNTKSSRWIANDALRELKSEAVQKRLK